MNASNRARRKRQLREPAGDPPNHNQKSKKKRNGGEARPSVDATTDTSSNTINCSFCLQVPAALTVQLPVLRHRHKRAATPYCLACYYTTAVVRMDPEKYVQVLDQKQVDEQLPPMQQMFNEVYLELQKELSEEAARSFQRQQKDPLAMLLHGGASRKSSVPRPKKKAGDNADGGFLRNVPLPQRLIQTQRQQAMLHDAQMERMNQAAASGAAGTAFDAGSNTSGHVFKRRKSSGNSIWNLAMDPNAKLPDDDGNEQTSSSTAMIQNNNEQYVLSTCSCGSKDVQNIGNMTSRNQDMRKGETWGMKDRGNDVVSRYQCNECGKTWNEEE